MYTRLVAIGLLKGQQRLSGLIGLLNPLAWKSARIPKFFFFLAYGMQTIDFTIFSPKGSHDICILLPCGGKQFCVTKGANRRLHLCLNM